VFWSLALMCASEMLLIPPTVEAFELAAAPFTDAIPATDTAEAATETVQSACGRYR
jgi:hypothetical protein